MKTEQKRVYTMVDTLREGRCIYASSIKSMLVKAHKMCGWYDVFYDGHRIGTIKMDAQYYHKMGTIQCATFESSNRAWRSMSLSERYEGQYNAPRGYMYDVRNGNVVLVRAMRRRGR